MALRVVARRYQAATVETRGDARRGEDRPRAFDARRAGRTVQPDRRASDPHGAGAVTGGMGRALQTCRSAEHTSALQSLMRISYAVFCLKKNNNTYSQNPYRSC